MNANSLKAKYLWCAQELEILKKREARLTSWAKEVHHLLHLILVEREREEGARKEINQE